MIAVWCLAIPVLSLFLIGLPLRGLLARGKPLDEQAWIQVPFVGLALTVLLLQFQLQLDMPLKYGVLALWGSAAALWVAWWRQGAVQSSLRGVPLWPLVAGAVVLAVDAVGLVQIGPNDYVGRSWWDQSNYTVMAECFRNEGFDINYGNIGQRPWLARVVDLKDFRVGQSVLQGYHGIITRMDTRTLFMPTILLGGPLVALALYAAGRTLAMARWQAALAGCFGGLVPGVTLLMQESFLSHALAIPLLLFLPTLLTGYLRQRNLGLLITTALCLGVLTSIYTEFLAFELVLVTAFLMLALCQRQRNWQHLLSFAVLLAAPWMCNPLYIRMTGYLSADYLAAGAPFAHIYPWGYTHFGLAVLWVGDFCLEPDGWVYQTGALRFGRAMIVCGLAGLVATAALGLWRWWRSGRQLEQAAFALPLSLVGLVMIPGLLYLRDKEHPYQFFKMLTTVSPLFALGAVALVALLVRGIHMRPRLPQWSRRLAGGAVWLPVILGAATVAAGSYRITVNSTEPDRTHRTHQNAALGTDFREVRQRLEAMQDRNLLVRAWGANPGYCQVWAYYFARGNRVWMADPIHNDGLNVRKRAAFAHLADMTQLPPDCLVLTPHQTMFLMPPQALTPAEIVWQTANHTLWKLGQHPWACITAADNPYGVDPLSGNRLWLGGGETTLHLFANQPGIGQLTLALVAGPCIDRDEKIRLRIKDSHGSEQMLETASGRVVLPVFLDRGASTIAVQVLNDKRRSLGADPRALLAELYVLAVDLLPRPAGTPWAAITRVDNPYHFENAAETMLWLGGGDTQLNVFASTAGVAHLQLTVAPGPNVEQAELLAFDVTGAHGTVRHLLQPGRCRLDLPVVQGNNVLTIRPLNAVRGATPGDPRKLASLWTLEALGLDRPSGETRGASAGN